MKFGFGSLVTSTLVLTALAAGCETPPPAATDAARPDSGPAIDAFTPPTDAPLSDAGPDAGPRVCPPNATDFPASADYACPTTRAAIMSMPNAFPYVVEPPGASPRAMAFEQMRTNGYFNYTRDPVASDFTTIQDLYIGGGEGLASRMERRFDAHFPTPDTSGLTGPTRLCQYDAIWRANTDFCVGPSALTPIMLDALQRGQRGDTSEPLRNQAARIEAVVTWFLHVSTYKEALTCAVVYPGGDGGTDDCDSAWGYYTGGADRTSGVGYSAMVRSLEPATHGRIWDSLLALRCWREMDSSDPAMQNPNMLTLPRQAFFDRAHAQEDVALNRGITVVLIDRLRTFQRTTGQEKAAHLVFLRTLLAPIAARTLTDSMGAMTMYPARAALFDHTIRSVNPTAADFIQTEIGQDAADIDVDGIIARLDAAFPCP